MQLSYLCFSYVKGCSKNHNVTTRNFQRECKVAFCLLNTDLKQILTMARVILHNEKDGDTFELREDKNFLQYIDQFT